MFVKNKDRSMEVKKIIQDEFSWIVKVLRSSKSYFQIKTSIKLFDNFCKKWFLDEKYHDEKMRYMLRFQNKQWGQEQKLINKLRNEIILVR